jgi:H+-transporting ATPase
VIDSAIDQARQIFGRITTYTIYRVALTMDIMFLVVLTSVFLGFQPLTAVMIVIMSLLDDVPIMTIAYDHTPISPRPIRWRMPRMLAISAVLGFFSVVQSFGLLLVGLEVISDPRWAWVGLADRGHLQTVMFLQLVAGGHLLLFVTRSEGWFFRPPYPAVPLLFAIFATQALAVLMCGYGWLMPAIPWRIVLWVWVYNLAWMVVLGGVRLAAERLIDHRTAARARSAALVTRPLQPQAGAT